MCPHPSAGAGHPCWMASEGTKSNCEVAYRPVKSNRQKILKQVARCDLPCKHNSNTGSSKSLCLGSVDDGMPQHPDCTIDINHRPPPRPPICLKRFGSAVGQALVSGLQGRARHTLAIFSLFPQFFTHPMCNQLDVWPLGVTCRMDSPQTAEMRPLAWRTPPVARLLHVGRVVAACPLLRFNSTRSHGALHHEGGARMRTESIWVSFFFLTCTQFGVWFVPEYAGKI